MANSKSSKKRVKINERNRIENRHYKGAIKGSTKIYLESLNKFLSIVTKESFIEAKNSLKVVNNNLDKAAKKNVIHQNKSIRKKIQLNSSLKNAINYGKLNK